MEKTQISHDTAFVVRHYRKGVFDRRKAWLSLHLLSRPWWRRHIAAAAAGVAVVIAAAAASVVYYSGNDRQDVQEVDTVAPASVEVADTTARFEFNDTRISVAAGQIEKAYGITLSGLPEDDPSVTLTFEGTADDLVKLINESLDSNIAISR